MYSEPDDEMFEYNIILSRFLNRPTTLISLGFIEHHSPSYVSDILKGIRGWGRTVWGNAYVVTTHGIRMDKIDYLCERVLPSLWDAYEPIRKACRHGVPPTCLAAYNALQAVEGIASFMAAQVVADLKNTPGHPLGVARDRREFVAPGPGSLRGVSWFQHSTAQHLSPSTFLADVREIREYVESQIYWFSAIDNQDLQNCLCEFDKYCRVRSGSGRSKRRYNGI